MNLTYSGYSEIAINLNEKGNCLRTQKDADQTVDRVDKYPTLSASKKNILITDIVTPFQFRFFSLV